jgi:hypothetical protein
LTLVTKPSLKHTFQTSIGIEVTHQVHTAQHHQVGV